MNVTLQNGAPGCTLTTSAGTYVLPHGQTAWALPDAGNVTVTATNGTSITLAVPVADSTVLIGTTGAGAPSWAEIPPAGPDYAAFGGGMALVLGLGLPFLGLRWFKRLSSPSAD
jgi:hypothetical protein